MLLRLIRDSRLCSIVRLERIVLDNVKNIKHGEVCLLNPRRPDGPRIVGLYGQNGSGKSTLIDVLDAIRQCMSGKSVDDKVAYLVSADSESGRVECEFSIECGESIHMRAVYSFCITSEPALSSSTENPKDRPKERDPRPRITNEELSVSSSEGNAASQMTVAIDTSSEPVFGPASNFKLLVGEGKRVRVTLPSIRPGNEPIDLARSKRQAYDESRSFVFSRELLDAILEHRHRSIEEANARGENWDTLLDDVCRTIMALSNFARQHIYVLNSYDAGSALAGTFRLSVVTNDLGMPSSAVGMDEELESYGIYSRLRYDRPSLLSEGTYKCTQSMIDTMNTIMGQIVPGLTLSADVVGETTTEKGAEMLLVEIRSNRDGRSIPFWCESGGIKRIVSFVNLLVLMYNDPRVLVAIDELDSGIFEYLLGELLSIVAEHGVGQLVFTSHNLRPLETIDRGYICFTTTNARNRYIRIENVKSTTNLRDLYFRDILLDGQEEQLYDPTDNGRIRLALMEVGMEDGS